MRQRFIQSFSTSGDVQTAIDGGQLGKPYVVYLEDEKRIDYDTMDVGPDPLTFDILTDGYINWEASISPSDAKAIRYSLNGGEWTEIISVDGGDCRIPVVAGDTLRFLGDNKRYGNSEDGPANRFANSTAEFNARGNIMSLVDSENFDTLTTVSSNAFNGLFRNARTLKDASGLVLPATTLAENCYKELFGSCVSLTAVPALPATTLAGGCYMYMFYGCTSLITAPELPAEVLADSCYYWMFQGCTSLTAAPELPAATLAEYCYGGMFLGCTGLTTAPELPATTLAQGCYSNMFKDCTSLTTAPELPATTLAADCYTGMFKGCTSLITAPELPAEVLADSCYYWMFRGCVNLNYIKCLATDITAADCTYDWVRDVAATGTFVKRPDATWSTGTSGIPANWTVEDADI